MRGFVCQFRRAGAVLDFLRQHAQVTDDPIGGGGFGGGGWTSSTYGGSQGGGDLLGGGGRF